MIKPVSRMIYLLSVSRNRIEWRGNGFCRSDQEPREGDARCPRGCRLAVSWESRRVWYVFVLEAVTLPCIRGSPVNRVASGLPRHYTHWHASIVHPSILSIVVDSSEAFNCDPFYYFFRSYVKGSDNSSFCAKCAQVGWIKEESIRCTDRNRV